MNSNFAENLKRIRKENNLSQEQLADKLGVSRQSVSKWESQQAYPEMDKVIQLCNMFNLNIDELLNKDIKEVREEKETKNRINKYLDDFLNFVTKTVNMFSSMTEKQKLKCILEQIVIIFALLIICSIIGSIGDSIVIGFRSILPSKAYYLLHGILETIYLAIYVILSFIVLVHVFKTRYLNYYTDNKLSIKKENTVEDKAIKNNTKEEKIVKEEKVIIRDPKDSDYGFIKGLLKCIVFFIKIFAMFVLIGAACSLVGITTALFLFMYHIFVNGIFVGLSIGFIGLVAINIIFLICVYDFIFNKKIPVKRIFITFIISLVLGGIGIGIVMINSINLKLHQTTYTRDNTIEKIYPYNDMLTFTTNDLSNYIFKIDNSLENEVKLEVNYNETVNEIEIAGTNSVVIHSKNLIEENFFSFYKQVINSLKKNELPSFTYEGHEVIITTSENNIRNIIKNMTKNSDSDVSINDNTYYLTIYHTNYYSICYMKDGYHNTCTSVRGDYDKGDFSYSSDGLIYDSNKYECSKEFDHYYCEKKLTN